MPLRMSRSSGSSGSRAIPIMNAGSIALRLFERISAEKFRRPTMFATVTKSDASKAGKPRVYFDGKHDWKDAYYISIKCEAPPIGAKIEAQTHMTNYQGKDYWHLDKWKLVEEQKVIPVLPPMAPANGSPPKPNGGWDIPSGDLSRFVSNIVGSAIEKGLIQDPEEIYSWTAAGYRAANQLRTGKIQDFNDMKMLPLSEDNPTEINDDEPVPF